MRALGPLVLLLTGVVTLRLAVSGSYTAYVRVGMFWALVGSGALLAALGLLGLWQLRGGRTEHADADADARAGAADEHEGAHAHAHAGPPGVAYLLLLPLLVAYAVAPPSLGAYSAELSAGSVLPEVRTGFAPLEPGTDGVADVGLAEAVRRTSQDVTTVRDQPLRVTGFVVPDQAGEVLLTRFVIRCCAADGTPAQVRLTLPPGTPELPADQWLEVVMTLEAPRGPQDTAPAFVAQSVRPVDAPDDPYET